MAGFLPGAAHFRRELPLSGTCDVEEEEEVKIVASQVAYVAQPTEY